MTVIDAYQQTSKHGVMVDTWGSFIPGTRVKA